MISKKLQRVLFINFILLILIAIYRYYDQYFVPDYILLDTLCFTAITVIYIAMIMYFAISVYQRVMQKNIRNYLITFCVMSITWILLRNIKWRAFESLLPEARYMWYLFYIPMLLIPMYGFLIAQSLGKDENYRLNKKWNVLYVIAALFIGLVLTNDFHQLVFTFNPNFENWDYDYAYGVIYFVVLAFMSSMIIGTVFTLFKKWRKINRIKNSNLPIFVVAIGFVYLITYITHRDLANAFTDLTTFNLLIYMLFWESCIQVGLIHSNSKYSDFFQHSKLTAQIIDKNNQVILTSALAHPISNKEYIELKDKKSITTENMILHIAPITCGDVVWTKDISLINEMNKELAELQDELYGEVAFLEEERKLKEEHARIQKLNTIYDLISKEILPSMNKIEALISEAEKEDEQDIILKQINLISCYIKRKTNLLLQNDGGKSITNADMTNCYNESFRGLGLFGIGCDINYSPPTNTSTAIHFICYDLFEEVLEKTNFEVDMIFVNCLQDKDSIRFTIELSNDKTITQNTFLTFKKDELNNLSGKLTIYENEDSTLVLLLFSKCKEVE